VLVGPGDDAAVVAPPGHPLAITTDALVEGTHFRREWLTQEELGARAATVNLSDLAAMAAQPAYVLIAIAAPSEMVAADLDRLIDAFTARSEAAGALVIGGNLARAPVLSLTVTALGWLDGPCLTRQGAKPGDRLVVTGTLGGAAAAVSAWLGGGSPPAPVRERFVNPVARITAGRALAAAGAHAAIDVSDGLMQDLGHLCRASGVGAAIERERLPRLAEVRALDAAGADFAATGGEDYELLFAWPAEREAQLDDLARSLELPLTVIGHCTEDVDRIDLLLPDGAVHRTGPRAGFDHFAVPPEAPGRGVDVEARSPTRAGGAKR
jgi:thiamine-monophosphate kinase